MNRRPPPDPGSVAIGFVLAPLSGSLTLALGLDAHDLVGHSSNSGTDVLLIFALTPLIVVACMMVAVVKTLVVGVPLYLLLLSRSRIRLPTSLLFGAFVAAAPWAALADWSRDTAFPPMLPFLGVMAACGGVGGLVFWLCLAAAPWAAARQDAQHRPSQGASGSRASISS